MSQQLRDGVIASAVRHPDAHFSDVVVQQYFGEYLKDKSKYSQKLLPIGLIARRSDISKFGGGSLYTERGTVNGCGYSLFDNTNMNLSNSDWSIDVFLYSGSIPSGTQGNILGRYYATAQRGWKLWYDKTNKRMSFSVSTDGTTDFGTAYFRMGATNDGTTEANFFNSAWHHVAITRVGGVIYVHVDGGQGNTTIAIGTTAIWDSGTCYTVIGSVANSATLRRVLSSCWEGYIDEVRLSVGTARYAAGTITVPTTRFGRNSITDPLFSEVRLLVTFENRFTWGWEGTLPQTNLWTGGNSLDTPLTDADGLVMFSGISGKMFPYNSVMNFLGSDFTLELFQHKFTYATGATWQIFGLWGSSGNRCWRVFVTSNVIRFEYSFDGTAVNTVSIKTGLVNAVAYGPLDIAIVRSGGTLYVYLNGTQVTSVAIGSNLFDVSTAGTDNLAWYGNGFGSEAAGTSNRVKAMRLSKFARYTGSTYVVPKLPLPQN